MQIKDAGHPVNAGLDPTVPMFFDATQGSWRASSGSVNIGNVPNVNQTGGPWAVSGTVAAGLQNAAGTLDATRNNYSQSLKSDFLIGAGITSGAPFTNFNAKGVLFSLTVSAASGTNPTLGVQIQGQNADAVWFNLPGVAFAAQTAAGSPLTLYVEPGAPATANVSVNFRVPRTYRAVYSVGGTAVPSFSFSLDADYCL